VKSTYHAIIKCHQQQQEITSDVIFYMNTNDFHRIAGHVNKHTLYRTAKYYGTVLQGKMIPCIHCALSNIHQSPINSNILPRTTTVGERICIDTSMLTHPSLAGNKFWLIVVDNATDYTHGNISSAKRVIPKILSYNSYEKWKIEVHPYVEYSVTTQAKIDIVRTVLPIGICTWYCKVH
jgi:hypothetical protein